MEDRLQDGRDLVVIANEAKQSIWARNRDWIASSLTLLAMTDEAAYAAAAVTTWANSASRFDCER
jgi:hypothetical protein